MGVVLVRARVCVCVCVCVCVSVCVCVLGGAQYTKTDKLVYTLLNLLISFLSDCLTVVVAVLQLL